MIINNELCDGCGKCAGECHRKAIIKDSNGKYRIDAGLCSDCNDIFDVECVRVCPVRAITADDGTVPDFDAIARLRSEHLIWFIAILGARGDTATFEKGRREWDAFRRMISAAYLDPDFRVRLTKVFDDNCVGCGAKQDPEHVARITSLDVLCFEKLGVEAGTVMRLWDAVRLAEKKFSIPFIRELGVVPENVLNCYINGVSPGVK